MSKLLITKKRGGLWARLTALMVVLMMTTMQMNAQTVVNNASELTSAISTITAGGTIQLGADIDLTAQLNIVSGKDFTLDLNGYVLKQTATSGSVIAVASGASFIIKDSKPTALHYYTVDANGLWTLNTTATSGTAFEELTERPDANAVICLKGGAITGGKGGNGVSSSAWVMGSGGGIYNDGTLTMQGGNIVGNTITGASPSGAGVVNTAIFEMTGGKIVGNFAGITSGFAIGGGVSNMAISSTLSFSMTGDALVAFNRAQYHGGGVFFGKSGGYYSSNTTTFTMTENAKIAHNMVQSSSYSLAYGGGLSMLVAGSGYVFNVNGTMSGNASVSNNIVSCGSGTAYGGGLYMKANDNNSSANIVMSGSANIGYNKTNGKIESGGGVYIEGNYSNITLGGSAVVSDNTLADGTTADNIYLPTGRKISLGTGVSAPTTGMMAGVTTQSKPVGTTGVAFTNAATSGDVQYFSSDNNAYIVSHNNSGYLELKNRPNCCKNTATNVQYQTVNAAVNAAGSGHVIQMLENSTENVTVGSGKSITLDLNGKVLSATSGTVITNNGTLTLTDNSENGGGNVTGGEKGVEQNGTMTVGGKLNITGNTANLYLPEGNTVTVSTATPLTTGANIGVTTATAPTSGSPVAVTGTNDADYSQYFTSDNPLYKAKNLDGVVKLEFHPMAALITPTATTHYSTVADAVNAANASTVDCEVKILTSCTSDPFTIENVNNKVITLNTGDEGTELTITATSDNQMLIYAKTSLDLKGNGGMVIANIAFYKAVHVVYSNIASVTIRMYDGFVEKTINGGRRSRVLSLGDGPKCYIYGGRLLCPKGGEAGANQQLSTIVNVASYVYIYGGEFHWDVAGYDDPNKTYWAGVLDSAGAIEFKIYGGYFDGPLWWSGDASLKKYIFYGGKYTTNKLKNSDSAKEGTVVWTDYIGKDRTAKNIAEDYNGTTYYYEIMYNQDPVAVNVNTGVNYYTVQVAVALAQAGNTIKMLKNATENVTVDKTITLDLNGYVLKGTGSGSVVTVPNGANLTVKDSGAETATHYYTVDSYGQWIWDDNNTTDAKQYENLTAHPDANDVIALKGGAITYGESGGIYLNGGTFTLNSGSIVGNGSSTNNLSSGVRMSDGTLNVNGGYICGNHALSCGGGVRMTNGAFNMNGGVISDNASSSNGNGVQIDASGQTLAVFNMTDGLITRNYDSSHDTYFAQHFGGGGLLVWNNSRFNMTGGSIIGNSTGGPGGGIRMGANSQINIIGGTIQNNKAASAAGIYCESSANPTIGGTAVISGNTLTDGTTVNNLYLNTGKTVTVSSTTPLTNGANIGVTTATVPTSGNPVAVTSNYAASDVQYFKSDNAAYTTIYDDNKVKLSVIGSNVCKIVETGVMYATVTEAINNVGDNQTVQLLADINLTATMNVASDKNFTLDLNGKTLTASDATATAITNNGTLTLTDNSEDGGGKVTGGAKGVEQNGTLTVGGNLYITGNTANLYLPANKTVTVSSTTPLINSAHIGVTTATAPTPSAPVQITAKSDADYSAYFSSDNTSYNIRNAGNKVFLTSNNTEIAQDPTSTYTPTQIVNGSFDTRPFEAYKYNGTVYNTWPGDSPNSVNWSEVYPNGINGGWNSSETVICGGTLFEYVTDTKWHGSIWHNGAVIEMNAFNSAVLSQDLATRGGDVILWTIKHAARPNCGGSTQSMRVEIGAPMMNGTNIVRADGINSDINSRIVPSTLATYRSSGVTNPTDVTYGYGKSSELAGLEVYQSYGTGQKAWKDARGVYVIPANQSVTRFAFIAESTERPDCGNLLDDITFSTLIGNLHASIDDYGNIIITGYWGDADATKKLCVKVGKTENEIDMTGVLNKNFKITFPKDKIGDATTVDIYHQDYKQAKRTVTIDPYKQVTNFDPKFKGGFQYTNGINPNLGTAVFTDNGATVNGSTRLVTKGQPITFKVPNGYKYYDGTIYDMYFKITSNIDMASPEWKFTKDGYNRFLTLAFDNGIDKDFNMEMWLQSGNVVVDYIDIIGGSCYVGNNGEYCEGTRPYSDDGYIYTNVDNPTSNWAWDADKSAWKSTNTSFTNYPDIYILGHGMSVDHTLKGGYFGNANCGGEFVFGYITKNVTFKAEFADGSAATDVTFSYTNPATFSGNVLMVPVNKTIGTLPTATPSTVKHWYVGDHKTTTYTAEQIRELTVTSDMTVTAVMQTTCVNTTTNKQYAMVQSAVNEAATNVTIKMLANTTENLTINGKTITLDLNGNNIVKSSGDNAITVSNGSLTIKDDTETAGGVNGGISKDNSSTVKIEGGKYSQDPTPFLDINHAAKPTGTQPYIYEIVIDPESIVCTDGTHSFTSLKHAIEFNNGKSENISIKLSNNTNEDPITIATGQDITLDLNGKTIASANGGTVITNNGTLTVIDSSDGNGIITGATTDYAKGIYNEGTLNLYAGNVTGNADGVLAYGKLTVGGKAVISLNGPAEGRKDLCLPDNTTFTIATGTYAPTTMNIGITTQTAPSSGIDIPLTGKNVNDYSQHFFGDDSRYSVINTEGNVLKLTNEVKVLISADPEKIAEVKIYNANTGVEITDPTHIIYGTMVTIKATSAEQGYAFKGWYHADGTMFSGKYEHTFKATQDLNLTAKFTDQVIWVRVKKGN